MECTIPEDTPVLSLFLCFCASKFMFLQAWLKWQFICTYFPSSILSYLLCWVCVDWRYAWRGGQAKKKEWTHQVIWQELDSECVFEREKGIDKRETCKCVCVCKSVTQKQPEAGWQWGEAHWGQAADGAYTRTSCGFNTVYLQTCQLGNTLTWGLGLCRVAIFRHLSRTAMQL